MREFMDGISEQVCDRCENRENCMGQLELASSEMFGTLLLAQEQGILVPEQMPARFLRECIHLERFVSGDKSKSADGTYDDGRTK